MERSVISIEVELRPCLIRKEKALFHKWIIERDGTTKGLVEDDRGKMHLVTPEDIQFMDYKIKEYIFKRELVDNVNKGL